MTSTPIETLDNGRQVLARYQSQRSPHLQVVLCQWEGQFVTWTYNVQSGGFCHGHYFSDVGNPTAFGKALIDFCERCKRER